jgi:hypothetical protein
MARPAEVIQSESQCTGRIHEVVAPRQLSTADLRRYKEDGVILIRQAMSLVLLDAVDADITARVALLERQCGIRAPSGEPTNDATARRAALNARLRNLYERQPELQGVLYDAMSLSPSIAACAADAAVHELVRQLLAPVFSIHARRILLMSPPNNEWHLPLWHQDWYYNEGPYSTMTLYAPLQYTTSFNGGLKLALGEWRGGCIEHGAYDHGVRTKWNSLPPERVMQYAHVAEPELERGDILLFNSLVPHSAQINQSDQVRMVVNLRFQDLTDAEFTQAGWRTGSIVHARDALVRKPAIPNVIRESKNLSRGDNDYLSSVQANWECSSLSVAAKLDAFTNFASRQAITKFLARAEVFQKQLHVNGSIVEMGVFHGASLMSWAHLSSIYEPVNYLRKIVGFDSFGGFPKISKQDRGGKSEHLRKGGFHADDSYRHLQRSIELYDANRLMNHIPKVELVRGDICKTLPAYVKHNAHLVVSLLHLDVDLYEPTKCALELLVPRMPKGAIILFDELNMDLFPGETLAVMETIGIPSLRLQRFPFATSMSYAVID